MNQQNRKIVWSLIQKHGDFLKAKLKPHPNHPKGRNPYAHICTLINNYFNCSYKELPDDKVEELKVFIVKIDK